MRHLLLAALLVAAHFSFGQKFLFGTTPFSGTGAGKQQFKSSEYIYGRLELPTTVDEFFKIPRSSSDADHPTTVLVYRVEVEKDGIRMGSNSWPYMKITPEQKAANFINFDVLPEPKVATTQTCGLADYSSNVGSAPLYFMFTERNFPDNGKYTIKIKMAYFKMDPYNPTLEKPEEEWKSASGKFEFEFNTDDLEKLQAHKADADKLVKSNADSQAMAARGLPKEWNMKNASTNGYTEKQITDLILQKAKAGTKIFKVVLYPVTGPAWVIEKNDIDLPLRKWHNQTIGYFKQTDGHCFYNTGGLRQEYEGGGQYGATFFEKVSEMEINCKNIPAVK